ncbi:hypothetical protein HERIO_1371 [Hepatospora eriocheir]|uniref:Uncharacterized protein n=1 Tax=Hepatospora eriocheir TaxID=1081669 RepID=A0A1X0QAB3_9MICR|nr:hypothetical protein HERIO_1371 [Hepatospora eriocheir]
MVSINFSELEVISRINEYERDLFFSKLEGKFDRFINFIDSNIYILEENNLNELIINEILILRRIINRFNKNSGFIFPSDYKKYINDQLKRVGEKLFEIEYSKLINFRTYENVDRITYLLTKLFPIKLVKEYLIESKYPNDVTKIREEKNRVEFFRYEMFNNMKNDIPLTDEIFSDEYSYKKIKVESMSEINIDNTEDNLFVIRYKRRIFKFKKFHIYVDSDIEIGDHNKNFRFVNFNIIKVDKRLSYKIETTKEFDMLRSFYKYKLKEEINSANELVVVNSLNSNNLPTNLSDKNWLYLSVSLGSLGTFFLNFNKAHNSGVLFMFVSILFGLYSIFLRLDNNSLHISGDFSEMPVLLMGIFLLTLLVIFYSQF